MKIVNPLVSIIIPTYNRGAYLNQCLNSITNQTYKNYEVIICDDGSIDNTLEVVKKFENQICIRYDYAPNTGGPAAPRNRGIMLAKGDLIAFLDSDDYWHAEKLKFSVRAFNKNVDLVYHDLEIYPSKIIFFYKKRIKTFQPKNDIFSNLMIRGNCVTLSSAVIRKSILDNIEFFNTSNEMVSIEDFDFWLRLSLNGAKFLKLKKCLGYYNNTNSDKLTKHNNRVDYDKYLYLYNMYNYLLTIEDNKKALYFTHYNLARSSFLDNNYEISLVHLKYILKKFRFNSITLKSIFMLTIINFKK
jgi:glycosyltransferase involved in cell wall biosynthesis